MKLKKWILILFLGFAVLSLFVVGAAFLAVSDSAREFAKNHILPLVREYHPLRHIREAAVSVKTVLHKEGGGETAAKVERPVGFAGSRAEKDGNLVSWISPFSDRVSPDERPDPGKIHPSGKVRPLDLVGLRGETLSFQVVLRSPSSLDNLSVRLSAPGCVTVHRFLEYYVRLMVHTGSKYGPLKEVVNPDPLIPFTDPYQPGHRVVSAVSVKPDFDQPVWIDVRFGRSCPAGKYDGTLTILRNGSIVRSVPVAYEILSPQLPERVNLDRWMEIYVSRLWQGEFIPNDQAFKTILYRYFRMAHAYGFSTNPTGDIGPKIDWDWNTGTPKSVDWSHYDDIYTPYLSGELTGQTPNVLALPVPTDSLGVGWWGGFMIEGGSPTPIEEWKGIPDKATRSLARLLVEHWKEKGWPIERTFAYPFDEPMHKLVYYQDIYKLIRKVTDSLHDGSDGKVRLMLTDAPWPWLKQQKGHDKGVMDSVVDIWAPSSETYIPDRMKKYQSDGKRTWFYQSGAPFIGGSDLADTGLGFRMWFWAAWKYRVNGVFYWVSNFWGGNSAASNAFQRQGSGDGVVFYPGHQLHFIGYPDIDGPFPSVRMAQWRRGYEDYKYFVLLKQASKGADADRTVNALVRKALDDGGYIPYWRNPLWWKPGDWSHDPLEWHRARVNLSREIAGLSGK